MNKYFLYFFTIRFGKRVPSSSDGDGRSRMGWKTDENPKFCLKLKTPTWQSNQTTEGRLKEQTSRNGNEDFAQRKAMEDFATGLTLHLKYVTQSACNARKRTHSENICIFKG